MEKKYWISMGVLLLVLGGCKKSLEAIEPLAQLEPECLEWTICTETKSTMYNVSEGDCIKGLDTGQAQKFFDILIKNDIKMAMECSKHIRDAKGELIIKQIDIGG